MVNLGNSFNAEAVPEASNYDLLPAGWYAMQIVDSEQKESKAGNPYLSLVCEMIEADHPQFRGRRIWVNLSLWGPSPKAQEIAQGQLASICKGLGLGQINDTNELHHKPLAVKVKIEKGSNGYADRNGAQAFDAYGARFGGATAPASAPAPQPAQATSNGTQKAPWE